VRDQPEPARLSPRCAGCGGEIARGRAFCTACGRATPAGLREVADRSRRELAGVRRSLLALVVTFAGVLGVLIAASAAPADEALRLLLVEGGLFAVGLAAVLAQGGDAWRASLAGPTRARTAALGLVVGLVGYAFSAAWVRLLERALEGGPAPAEASAPPLFLLFATVVVLTALVEEWLCRGVLWQALERHAPHSTTLVLSAFLFALLHLLGGNAWLEVPHRLAFGLLLGLLRARGGSLGPCVIAHGAHNLLAVLLG
jgi:membrane protease YdiL (CAAX protease family)